MELAGSMALNLDCDTTYLVAALVFRLGHSRHMVFTSRGRSQRSLLIHCREVPSNCVANMCNLAISGEGGIFVEL
jgi:hypothetical protein